MSIYVLQYGDLLKIGYSSELPKRVAAIMWSIPGEVTFVGHMPGDEEVESHLHAIFADHRFSGEWFRDHSELRQFCEIALIKTLPAQQERQVTCRTVQSRTESITVRARLRDYAIKRWPAATHRERIVNLADTLGWSRSRVFDFYHANPRAVLRSTEASRIAAVLALAIAPELAAETD